jgi:Spy/CpxP family protein refolding chaperone
MFRKLDAMVLMMNTSTTPVSTAVIFVASGAWRRVTKEFCRMKKVLLCGLLGIGIMGFGSALSAQMPPGPNGGHHPGKPLTTDERLQRLTQALNLTDEQQQKIRPILENETQQLDALHQNTALAGPDKRDKMLAIRDTTTSQIKPILNPDQQAKYEQMTARHAPPPAPGQSQGQDQGQGQPPPPPPPQ